MVIKIQKTLNVENFKNFRVKRFISLIIINLGEMQFGIDDSV